MRNRIHSIFAASPRVFCWRWIVWLRDAMKAKQIRRRRRRRRRMFSPIWMRTISRWIIRNNFRWHGS